MKRVFLDHNVPARIIESLKAFDTKLARDLGWDQMHNGKLLSAVEENGFDVLVTADKSMSSEQNLVGRKIGIVTMSTNGWRIVRDYVPAIVQAIHKCKPGQVLPVFCGEFKRGK